MHEFRNDEWLQAISDHPETIDTDLHVAVALLLTGSGNGVTFPCPDCGQRELIDQDEVDDSIAALMDFGFVESVAAVEVDGGEESGGWQRVHNGAADQRAAASPRRKSAARAAAVAT